MEKVRVLFLRAEPHDRFDAGAVVPAPIKDHDLPGGRKVWQITLKVDLRFLSIRRRRKRYHTKNAWADPFGDRFYRAALPGTVAALENHDNTQSLVFHP